MQAEGPLNMLTSLCIFGVLGRIEAPLGAGINRPQNDAS